jgi:hypothetical protein
MKKLIFTLLMICFGYGVMLAQAPKRIAFLHDPTVPVAQSGLMKNLRSAGYSVDSFYTSPSGVFNFDTLAKFDLIIASRGVSSGDFSDFAAWDTLKVPVFVLSPFVSRNNRMHLFNTNTVVAPDSAAMASWNKNQITKALPILNKDKTLDAVFNGVTTDSLAFPFYKWAYCFQDYYRSDWALDAITGKLLVVLPDTASYGAGAILMARWAPGTECYLGAGIHVRYLSYMDIGVDDGGNQYNYDNYTTNSLQLFMNEVAFLISNKNETTGIQELSIKSQFNVYPNPSSNGNFLIDLNAVKTQSANVQIYALTGQLLYAKDFLSSGNINIQSGLNKGMYLLVVNVNGNKSAQKIVIN